MGRDGSVVSVAAPDAVNQELYGIVTAVSSGTYTDADGSSYTARIYTITDTSGASSDYIYEDQYIVAGNVVKVTFSSGKTQITRLSSNRISGTVNAENKTIGQWDLSDQVQILDVSGTKAVRIYPSRLDGVALSSEDVIYCAFDASGRITHLILDDVTHDMHTYGLVTKVSSNAESNIKTYTYYEDGALKTLSAVTGMHTAGYGGCMIQKENGAITRMTALFSFRATEIGANYVYSGSTKYTLSGSVSVYVRRNSGYYLSSVSDISDLTQYTVTAYFDKAEREGGRVRVLLAE